MVIAGGTNAGMQYARTGRVSKLGWENGGVLQAMAIGAISGAVSGGVGSVVSGAITGTVSGSGGAALGGVAGGVASGAAGGATSRPRTLRARRSAETAGLGLGGTLADQLGLGPRLAAPLVRLMPR